MADQTVSIGIEVQLQDLISTLTRAEGMTDAQASKLVKGLEKSVKSAEKAFKSAEKSQKDAAKASQELRDRFGGLGDVANALGMGPLDGLASKGEALVRGFADLGVSAGAGVAIAGLAGVAVATVGAIAGIVKVTQAAAEYAKELKAFRGLEGFGITDTALNSLTSATASLDSLKTIGKQAVIVLGTEFAPTVEKVGTTLVAFGLMALDAFQAFADGKNVLREVAVFMVDKLVKSFLMPGTVISNLIGLLGDLASVVGMDGLGQALSDVEAGFDGFTRSIAETSVDYWLGEAKSGMDELGISTGDYYARAERLVQVQEKVNAKLKETKTTVDTVYPAIYGLNAALANVGNIDTSGLDAAILAIEDIGSAYEEALAMGQGYDADMMTGREALDASYQAELSQIAELESRTGDVALADELRTKAAKSYSKQRVKLLNQETQSYMAAGESFFSTISQAAAAGFEATHKQNAKTAERYLAFWKAASIAETVISGATAAIEAYKSASSIPVVGWVLGPIAAAAVAGVTAAQVAKIASTDFPSYHVGGMAPDERTALLTRKESILTPRATAAIGGPGAVDALNRGDTGSGRVAYYQVYKHHIYQSAMRDEYKVPGSALRGIIRSNTSNIPGRR